MTLKARSMLLVALGCMLALSACEARRGGGRGRSRSRSYRYSSGGGGGGSGGGGSGSSVDIGTVIGIIAGIIGAVILFVCCYYGCCTDSSEDKETLETQHAKDGNIGTAHYGTGSDGGSSTRQHHLTPVGFEDKRPAPLDYDHSQEMVRPGIQTHVPSTACPSPGYHNASPGFQTEKRVLGDDDNRDYSSTDNYTATRGSLVHQDAMAYGDVPPSHPSPAAFDHHAGGALPYPTSPPTSLPSVEPPPYPGY